MKQHNYFFQCTTLLALVFGLQTSGLVAQEMATTVQSSLKGAKPLFVNGENATPAVLQKWNADGSYTFQTENGKSNIAQEQLVRWGNPTNDAARPRVQLVDGTILVLEEAWKVKERVRMLGNSVHLATKSLGERSLSREMVQVLYLHPLASSKQQVTSSGAKKHTTRGMSRHVVTLTNGDRLLGNVTAIEENQLTMLVRSKETTIAAERVASVQLNHPDSQSKRKNARWMLLGLGDGSRLAVRSWDKKVTKPQEYYLRFTTHAGAEFSLRNTKKNSLHASVRQECFVSIGRSTGKVPPCTFLRYSLGISKGQKRAKGYVSIREESFR